MRGPVRDALSPDLNCVAPELRDAQDLGASAARFRPTASKTRANPAARSDARHLEGAKRVLDSPAERAPHVCAPGHGAAACLSALIQCETELAQSNLAHLHCCARPPTTLHPRRGLSCRRRSIALHSAQHVRSARFGSAGSCTMVEDLYSLWLMPRGALVGGHGGGTPGIELGRVCFAPAWSANN